MQSAGGTGAFVSLFNATLDYGDERGGAHAYLAEDLPRLNTDSWRVLPDGRMETSYRLRPNLMWHDGRPLSADDFVFAWRVYATPELGVASSLPLIHMEDVMAPDQRSLVIRWRRPYPDASFLKQGFQALPRHILEQPFEQMASDAFVNLPYWTQEYVGAGPYRLQRWEPGASVEASAFEGHVPAQAKIARVRVAFISDTNTALTNLLSGDGHITIDNLLMWEQGVTLQREWAANNGGTVLLSPILFRASQIQLRPEMASPRAILDVRVRRALAHAIDKRGINDALIGGQGILSDSII